MRGYARLCAHNSGKLQLSLLSQPPRMLSPQAPCTIQTNHTSRGSIPFRLYCLCTRRFVVRGPLSLSRPRVSEHRHIQAIPHTPPRREKKDRRTHRSGRKSIFGSHRPIGSSADHPGHPRAGTAPLFCLGGVATPPPGHCVRLCAATAPHRDSSSLTTTHRGHLSFSAGRCARARARAVALPRPFLSGQRAGA